MKGRYWTGSTGPTEVVSLVRCSAFRVPRYVLLLLVLRGFGVFASKAISSHTYAGRTFAELYKEFMTE